MAGVEAYYVGLVNFQNKYLTAESFGFQVNASGVNLKKKQMWLVEQDGAHIFLKSHLNRYLTADKNGKISCEAEEREEDAKFTVSYQADGKLALKSKHDRYLGGEEDQINAFATAIGKPESWTLQLAIHPQVNLLHVVRKRYAHLESNEIQVSEDIPWGGDALITLEFKQGKYAMLSSDSRYLNADGSLDATLTAKGQYLIEFHEGRVAFRTHEGKFLTCVGNKGKIQSNKKNVAGRDEIFALVDNHPQCMLTAQNERMVSIRQGNEVTANQRFEMTDKEIFQMEFDPKKAGKICMLANTREYWISNGDIKASSSERVDSAFFGIDWHGSHVSFQASSGKYVTIKPNGKLAPSADTVEEKEKFLLQLVNRPLLILRCEHGFVGMRGATTARLECNRSSYEVFKLHFEDGSYKLEGRNGKFAQIDGESNINLAGTSESCATFQFEFREHTKMCIKANNGKYLKGESNGAFTANGEKPGKNTLWEY